MNLRYAYSLHEPAVLALVALDGSERRELLDACDALVCGPGRRGAEQVIDEAGRANEVVYTAHFRVTYWAEHAFAFQAVRWCDRRYGTRDGYVGEFEHGPDVSPVELRRKPVPVPDSVLPATPDPPPAAHRIRSL